ncbi:MAG: ribosomal protein S18-alanine N-acetyltransferase [Gemmatimonadales bacterium]
MDDHSLIRRAESADASAIWQVERGTFSDPWSLAGIREMVEARATRTFVASSEGAIVGYVMARVSRPEGEILNLAVLPAHRRRGLGRTLLDTGLGWLEEHGAREVYLEVRESNAAALALYRARGFRPVGMRPDYYRNPREAALVLRCLLQASRQ